MRESAPVSERLYSPGLAAIFDVVKILRAPDGCPWDREQTHQSLRPYLLEETYELLEAIDSGDEDKLREELGDVLLQVAMHAQIAADENRFDAAAISEQEAAKMVARHPHVFGDRQVRDAEEVLRNWERDKLAGATADGLGQESAVDRATRTLPALAWALALQKRAARVGFDYDGALTSLADDARGIENVSAGREKSDNEFFEKLGDHLFALVNLARKRKANPEDALRAAGQRFARRFKRMEASAREQGLDIQSMDEGALKVLWTESA